MQLASHLFYSIEIIPYLFYSEVFAIKSVLFTQSTNRKSKNQFKDSLLNVLCHSYSNLLPIITYPFRGKDARSFRIGLDRNQ